ncbi:hypothetical protein ABIC28_005068 [Rhodococcus sp. PvR044]|jgi:hypothetical protein|nr:hypothetical protein [Rhodococcus sp. PvR099]PTR36483.1 hypothetical protein C8K38_12478 [Rhodococcus sp. OK611]SNX93970.1 hypothetical protein SAMN05447004_12578 [Rhodococcus sp. OK270]
MGSLGEFLLSDANPLSGVIGGILLTIAMIFGSTGI